MFAIRKRHFRVAFIELLLSRINFQEAEEKESKLFRFRRNGRERPNPNICFKRLREYLGHRRHATVTVNNYIKAFSPNKSTFEAGRIRKYHCIHCTMQESQEALGS